MLKSPPAKSYHANFIFSLALISKRSLKIINKVNGDGGQANANSNPRLRRGFGGQAKSK